MSAGAKMSKEQAAQFALLPDSEQLSRLQVNENNGRGVSCIRTVVMYLHLGDIAKAKVCVNNEWDKISNYPDICDWLKEHDLADANAYVTR